MFLFLWRKEVEKFMKLHLGKFGGIFTEEKEAIITNDGIKIELSSDYQLTPDTRISVSFKNGNNTTKLVAKGNSFYIPSTIVFEGELFMYITLFLDKNCQKFNCESLHLKSIENEFKAVPVVAELTEQVKSLTQRIVALESLIAKHDSSIEQLWIAEEQ